MPLRHGCQTVNIIAHSIRSDISRDSSTCHFCMVKIRFGGVNKWLDGSEFEVQKKKKLRLNFGNGCLTCVCVEYSFSG